MDHGPYIAFVDAHAEGVRGDDEADRPLRPSPLRAIAFLQWEAGVIGCGAEAGVREPVRDPKRFPALAHVDDRSTRRALRDAKQPAELVLAARNPEGELGPSEVATQHMWFPEAQLFLDVGHHPFGGRGRERDHRHLREVLPQVADGQVGRPEVIPPLRDAMRFIDGDEGDGETIHACPEQVRPKSFRRHVQEVTMAQCTVLQGHVELLPTHARSERHGPHSPLAQTLHLVLHEGDERGHHEAATALHQRGQLEAEALSSPRGQQGEGVTALEHAAHHLILHRAQVLEAPDAGQDVV